MKIIITAASPNFDSNVDVRFGRGAYFIVVDPDTLEWQAHPNPAIGASNGASTLAAQFAANQQASSIISGDFGPNAFNALQAADIAMYLYGDCHTVREAIERFKAGLLQQAGAASAPGDHRQGA